jgi:hypothetical protein
LHAFYATRLGSIVVTSFICDIGLFGQGFHFGIELGQPGLLSAIQPTKMMRRVA